MKDGSISPTEKHISAIKTLKSPTDKPSLKRILGSRNWLKKYINNYSRKTCISYELLRKHVEFHWTKRHEAASQEIKNYLISNHVLKLSTGVGKYSLFCDGSRQGIGATLLETVDGSTYVVNYVSRSVSERGRKSSVTELELATIKFALKSFWYLLFNPKGFDLYTDHYAIVHIFAAKSPPATKNDYLSFINEYNSICSTLNARMTILQISWAIVPNMCIKVLKLVKWYILWRILHNSVHLELLQVMPPVPPLLLTHPQLRHLLLKWPLEPLKKTSPFWTHPEQRQSICCWEYPIS